MRLAGRPAETGGLCGASQSQDTLKSQRYGMESIMRYQEMTIEGRNAVSEALRAGKPIDRLFIQDHCQDGPVLTIKRLARAKDIPVKYVEKERLDQLSETGRHQGVIAYAAAYEYAQVEDMLAAAQEKGSR